MNNKILTYIYRSDEEFINIEDKEGLKEVIKDNTSI